MHFITDSLKDRLLFAIPKKGRLYEKCLELLQGADVQFTRSHRLDVCLVRNHPIALVFLPAADIPRFVGEGNVDLGITGKDMVAESGVGSLVTELLTLGFGKCALQVQVPEGGPIQSVEQLCGRKVVTSFDCLAEKYFRELDERVLNAEDRKAGKKTTIEYVGGSVEAACALGLADGIVDLVESGETMRAAGLHAIETILRSEAILIRSSRPASPAHAPLVDRISSRIAGVVAAGKYVMCQYNIERKRLDEGTAITPGRRAATVSPLDDSDWVAVSSMVIKSESADIMDRLQAIGASDILLLGLANCRV